MSGHDATKRLSCEIGPSPRENQIYFGAIMELWKSDVLRCMHVCNEKGDQLFFLASPHLESYVQKTAHQAVLISSQEE